MRDIASNAKKKIIALDTKGPEIRTGLLKGVDSRSKLSLDKGAEIEIIIDDAFKEYCTNDKPFIFSVYFA